MASKLSILQNFKTSDLKTSPYVYFGLSNVLPEKIYAEMEDSFPALDVFYSDSHRGKDAGVQQNTFYKLHANKLLGKQVQVSSIWNEFVSYHTSQEFLDELMDKVGDAVARVHPKFVEALQKKTGTGRPRAGIRNVSDDPAMADVAMDAMIGINSPVQQVNSRVIGVHLDNPKMLYATLFYLRHKDDTSKGGSFQVYEWKDRTRPAFTERRIIRDDAVILRDEVPYGRNQLVWFLNSFDAVHGVSVREQTPYPRRLCEVMADAEPTVKRLFELDPSPAPIRFIKKIASKLAKSA